MIAGAAGAALLFAVAVAPGAATGAKRAPAAARKPAAAPRYPRSLSLTLARRANALRLRATLAQARWAGSLSDIRRALDAADRADSEYAASLDSLGDGSAIRHGLPSGVAAPYADSLAGVALDLAFRGRVPAAEALLSGPLGGDGRLLPLRAWARGRTDGPQAGLALLDWPPERLPGTRLFPDAPRAGTAMLDPEDLALWTAASLADSARQGRAARAALWLLVERSGAPTVRKAARLSLARRLFAGGEAGLAEAVLTREPGRSLEETTLLARILGSGGDTLSAIGWLLSAVDRASNAAERYAAALPAARLALKGRADSLSSDRFDLLATTLGNLGEAALGLQLLDARRAPSDSAGAWDRMELQASLLLKARRYDDAAKRYRTLLQRGGATAKDRSGDALNLARALRGAHAFETMDSAFVLAASLSPGPARETAAWERAREWEDRKSALEAAAVYGWALARIESGSLAGPARVHAALAWERAGRADSARALLASPGEEEGMAWFWRGRLAADSADTAGARASFTRVARTQPLSYEGVRAREELGLPPALTPPGGAPRETRVPRREVAVPAAGVGVADLVGLPEAGEEALRACAGGTAEAAANGCVDALESRGIYRVGRRSPTTELRLTRPPAYPRAVLDAADSERVDPFLLWALMLQESGFDAKARSRAGAIGVLQLLPGTASKLAGRSVTADDLTDPELNVRLAARYFARLLREFGEPRAAIAAYNAGEEAVRRWRTDRPQVDDLWVELIPYRETRDYVKSVYTTWRQYETIYAAR